MKLFYFCYGSAHSSVTAANIHLGRLPLTGRPTLGEIINQPVFDRFPHSRLGEATRFGEDEHGNEIYVIGLSSSKPTLSNALRRFLEAQGVAADQVAFADTLHHAGMLMRIGGYASRRLGLIIPGRWLVAVGVWLAYDRFAGQVREVRRRLRPT